MRRLLSNVCLGVFVICCTWLGLAIHDAEAYHAAMMAERQEAQSHYPDIDARLELSIYRYGAALAVGSSDTGGGAYTQPDNLTNCLNATNQFAWCTSVSYAGAITYSGATPQTFTGATPITFAPTGITGSTTLAEAISGAATADLTLNTTDSACTVANWLFAAAGGLFVIQCNGKVLASKGIAVTGANFSLTGAGNILQYAQRIADTAACGTRSTPLASGGTCNGDEGFFTGAAGTTTINFNTAYGATADMQCQIWPDAGGAPIGPITYSSTSQIQVTTTAQTYAIRCPGVSGG